MKGAAGGTDGRWVGVGHSFAPDAAGAGRAALAAARAGREPCLVLVFASIAHDLGALVAAVRAELGPVTALAGCTTAGELSQVGGGRGSVVVAALGGDGLSAEVAVGLGASTRQREAGAEAAACLAAIDRPNRVLLLLTPGFVSHQEEIVRGAYSVTGATVPVVGGASGDDLTMTGTHQIAGDAVLTDAVVGIAVGSDHPLAVSMRHGWRKVGEPMVVSTSDGTTVSQLDDQPALDVYLGRLGAPAETYHDPLALNRFALVHPLGLQRLNGEDIRVPGEVDYESRSLICTADVPRGALVWLMEGDEVSVIEAAAGACSNALELLGGGPVAGALVFDCVGRRLILGDDLVEKEVAAIRSSLGDVPVAGFFTYGEIARSRGSSGVHNETFVVMALG
ncbi:MAG TPA: FIST N-terminal domain-containing protein [Acidimicrobiales bacterium]|nr:FIST N-terminal domain-containing protein [Acidimicrobiales bacterium]